MHVLSLGIVDNHNRGKFLSRNIYQNNQEINETFIFCYSNDILHWVICLHTTSQNEVCICTTICAESDRFPNNKNLTNLNVSNDYAHST